MEEREICVGDKVIFEYYPKPFGKPKWSKGIIQYIRVPVQISENLWTDTRIGVRYGFLNLCKKVINHSDIYIELSTQSLMRHPSHNLK